MLRRLVWLFAIWVALGAVLPWRAQPETSDPAVAMLLSSDARPEERDEAARRIAGRRTGESEEVIVRFLSDLGGVQNQVAMARAVAGEQLTSPRLVDPLFALLYGPRQVCEPAADALSNFKSDPNVLSRLIDASRQRTNEPARLAAISALGSILEKSAAEALVGLLTRDDEPPGIRSAAARALGNLSGYVDFGQDIQRWQQWWSENSTKSPTVFHTDLLENRAQRFDASQRALSELADSVSAILSTQYQTTPAEGRADFLLKLLTNPSPGIRVAGALIVRRERAEGRAIPDVATARLRQMIPDSNASVRLEVANALARMVDQESFEPMLAQLNQETNPDVRAALAGALGFLGNTSAVPRLIELLSDPSLLVARSAANSLEALGPQIRDSSPDLAVRTADALRELLSRTQVPGREAIREAAVAAMVPLRRAELVPVLQKLTKRSESLRVRRDAIRALGEIRDPNAAETIAQAFTDPEGGVRLDAVKAMGLIGATEFSSQIARLIDPGFENDQSVRDAAWQVLQSFLPQLSQQQLADFASRFDKDPEKQLAVRNQLAELFLSNKSLDDWADQKHNIGDVLVELNRFDEAAVNYGLALDQKSKQPSVSPAVIQRLITSRMKALLRATKYPEAMQFATEQMRRDAQQTEDLAVRIKEETERLTSAALETRNAKLLDDAIDLIDRSRKMDPALPERYRTMLTEIEQQIRQAQAKLKSGSEVPGARPLAGQGGTGTAGLGKD